MPSITQSVSGSRGAQVMSQKAALREALDGTQSSWGHGTLQAEGPERGVGREVLKRREHLGHLLQASHPGLTDTGHGICAYRVRSFWSSVFLQSCPETPSFPNSASMHSWVTQQLSLINCLWEWAFVGRAGTDRLGSLKSPLSHGATQVWGEFYHWSFALQNPQGSRGSSHFQSDLSLLWGIVKHLSRKLSERSYYISDSGFGCVIAGWFRVRGNFLWIGYCQ